MLFLVSLVEAKRFYVSFYWQSVKTNYSIILQYLLIVMVYVKDLLMLQAELGFLLACCFENFDLCAFKSGSLYREISKVLHYANDYKCFKLIMT